MTSHTESVAPAAGVNEAKCIHRDDVSEVWLADSNNPEHVAQIMGDSKANALITDAPYSLKTHAGHAKGKLTADRAAGYGKSHNPKRAREAAYSRRKAALGESGRRDIDYTFWSSDNVEHFCDLWAPRCNGWCVSITDDVLARDWSGSFECNGLLAFPPLPLLETGSRVRMMGDGPSNWTCWIIVARPRNAKFAKWGTLPGGYWQPSERDFNSSGGSNRIVGGKPMRAITSIVRDYSRPGDLIVDPCCGGGTTLMAAKILGRRCIGIDIKPEHAELSARLLSETRQQLQLLPESVPQNATQPELFPTLEATDASP